VTTLEIGLLQNSEPTTLAATAKRLRTARGLSRELAMHTTPSLVVMDYVGPAIGAAIFVVIMSLVREPTRRTVNAILVAGTCGVYLSGGFGLWELVYPVIAMPIVYRALASHRYIGAAWLMHSAWDLPHHFWGNPIWPFMPTSSFGCFEFDMLIAIWFLAGAPTIVRVGRAVVSAGRIAQA
jgi:hypothetical protein